MELTGVPIVVDHRITGVMVLPSITVREGSILVHIEIGAPECRTEKPALVCNCGRLRILWTRQRGSRA